MLTLGTLSSPLLGVTSGADSGAGWSYADPQTHNSVSSISSDLAASAVALMKVPMSFTSLKGRIPLPPSIIQLDITTAPAGE